MATAKRQAALATGPGAVKKKKHRYDTPPAGTGMTSSPAHAIARAENRATLYQKVLPLAEAAPPFKGEYTEQLGQLMFRFVSMGVTLDGIESLPNMPPLHILLLWLKSDHPFSKLYFEAKALLVPLFEERAQTAANNRLPSVIKTKRQVLNKDDEIVELVEVREVDNVERSKLIVNTYGWTLAHLAPKKHGRKDAVDDKPGEQLEALFQALKSGPAD
jgi:hypothetical protein